MVVSQSFDRCKGTSFSIQIWNLPGRDCSLSVIPLYSTVKAVHFFQSSVITLSQFWQLRMHDIKKISPLLPLKKKKKRKKKKKKILKYFEQLKNHIKRAASSHRWPLHFLSPIATWTLNILMSQIGSKGVWGWTTLWLRPTVERWFRSALDLGSGDTQSLAQQHNGSVGRGGGERREGRGSRDTVECLWENSWSSRALDFETISHWSWLFDMEITSKASAGFV